MKFRLRYQVHDFELEEGQFLIGRSANCQLSLDDPLVSRMHAALTVKSETVFVEDLGSRNGVRVNGQRVERVRNLEHGDRVGIGSQEMILLKNRDFRGDTQAQQPPTQRIEAFGLLGSLADKAIALGRGDEAERILSVHLQQILQDAQGGYETSAEVAERAARYGVKLAGTTGKGRWVDYVVELYTLLKRPCPADVVDELYTVLRKVRQVNPAMLRQYMEVLRASAAGLGPAERFLVGRIEGLSRLTGLK